MTEDKLPLSSQSAASKPGASPSGKGPSIGGPSSPPNHPAGASSRHAQADASSSTSRVNAVASSSSSHTNATASSSRSYGPAHSEASSSRLTNSAAGPFDYLSLEDLPMSPEKMVAPLLATIFHSLEDIKKLDAQQSEANAQMNHIEHNRRPGKTAREEAQHAMYTEAEVPGFIEMLSSEDIDVFSHAVHVLNHITARQPALLRDAVLIYMPFVVSLLPAISIYPTSESNSRASALLGLIHNISGTCRQCSNELEEHADLEFLVELLKKSIETGVRHTVVRFLEGMLKRASEEIRSGNRRGKGSGQDEVTQSGMEEIKNGGDVIVEEGASASSKGKGKLKESDGANDEWVDVSDEEEVESEAVEDHEPDWELEGKLTEILHTHFYRLVTLEDDVPSNDKGKGKAKAAQTLRWNTADSISAISTLEFALTRRMVSFSMTSFEAGALDFLLAVATTPSSDRDSTLTPTLSDARVAAVSCIGEVYLGIVERSLIPEDFPYDCNTDPDDARFELQGRILMPLLDMIDDPSDLRVSDKIVELLFKRFEDLDQAVQIYLWSHGGSVEKLVRKYAMAGARKSAKGKGKGTARGELVGPGVPGMGLGGHPAPWSSGERREISVTDILAKGFGLGHPMREGATESGPKEMGGKGKGKQIRIEAEDPSPIETLSLDMGAESPLIEMLDMSSNGKGKGKGKEGAPMETYWDAQRRCMQAPMPLRQKHNLKRSFADMLEPGMGENALDEPSFPYKKPSLPQFPSFPRMTFGHLEHPRPFVPTISEDVVHSILNDAGIGSKTDLLLERLVEQNPEGVAEAFRTFWGGPDVDDETRENLVRVLKSPLRSGALQVAAASAGVTVF